MQVQRQVLTPKQIPQVQQKIVQSPEALTDKQISDAYKTLGLKPGTPPQQLIEQLEAKQRELQKEDNKQGWQKNEALKKQQGVLQALLVNLKHALNKQEKIETGQELESQKQKNAKIKKFLLAIPKPRPEKSLVCKDAEEDDKNK